LAGRLKAEPDLGAALERGEVPAGRGRGPLAEFCRNLLASLPLGERGAGGLVSSVDAVSGSPDPWPGWLPL
jgi:hypothetical protein